METGQKVQYQDECPKHGTEINKEYSFGRLQEVSVKTHKGCSCCVLHINTGFNDGSEYYPTYEQAKSRATMAKAQLRTW